LLVAGLGEAPPPVVVCHRPTAAARLGEDARNALDILELYAFTCPADPVIPSPRGIAAALGLPAPATLEQEAATLRDATAMLLARLAASRNPEWPGIASVM